MEIKLNEHLAQSFAGALERSGEDREKVMERLIKTYVYNTYSRKVENYDGLAGFMKLPKDCEKGK